MRRFVRVDLDRIEDYRARIRALAKAARARFRLSRVILFGSFARGEIHELSDVDLVLVGDVPGRFHERPSAIRELTDLPLDVFVYTDVEWKEMVAEGNPFAEEVLATGIEL